MARVNFATIFIHHEDGALEPRMAVRVGGITFGPGVKFAQGVSFGGIDFSRFIGHDLEIETEGATVIIKGIYDA